MSSREPQQTWAPDLPSAGPPEEQTFPLSGRARYVQRLSFDERGRLVNWAVIQMRRLGGRWQRVAVYDVSHGKGVHVHLYDRQEREFTQVHLKPLTCYRDITESLDDVLKTLTTYWQENERRSDRGK